ncbi:MAG: PP2C family protein-serine/threonine phosphatase [Acidimicrobiales bacterium]
MSSVSQDAKSDRITTPPRHPVAGLSVVVLVVLLVLTAALAWGASDINQRNENRLLKLELRQAASVVAAAVPTIQIPLVSATQLADATNGNAGSFQKYMGEFVGTTGEFVFASLWRSQGGAPTMVTSVGTAPTTPATPATIDNFLLSAPRSNPFAVLNLLSGAQPSIAYAAAAGPSSRWVVFAERLIPKGRRLSVTKNSAFSQLNYALYLGSSSRPADLLGASSGGIPAGANSATDTVPFGNTSITLVATPSGELGGTLLARLALIVALGGAFFAVIGGIVTEYLVRRRTQAERLASENRRMYTEQRSIAEVLQHALLPRDLPQIAGIETAARYVSGRVGTEVGGDWYDVIPVDGNRFVCVVGDVSGHGVEAATLMARLHFAIRAFAAQGDSPAAIVNKLGPLVSLERDGSFATVVCGAVDVAARSITLVNAGHPPVLLLNGSEKRFVETTVSPPVGITDSTDYQSTTFSVPPHCTILTFTDGLVERRGEVIDVGHERLRSLVPDVPLSLDDLLDKLVGGMRDERYSDDVAILAVRWN